MQLRKTHNLKTAWNNSPNGLSVRLANKLLVIILHKRSIHNKINNLKYNKKIYINTKLHTLLNNNKTAYHSVFTN